MVILPNNLLRVQLHHNLLRVLLHQKILRGLLPNNLLRVQLHHNPLHHSLMMVLPMVPQHNQHTCLRNSCHTGSFQGMSPNRKRSGSQCMSQSKSSRGRRHPHRTQDLFPCSEEVGNLPCLCLGTSYPSNIRGSQSPYHTSPQFRSCSCLHTLRSNRPTRSPGRCSSCRTSNPQNRIHRRRRSQFLAHK